MFCMLVSSVTSFLQGGFVVPEDAVPFIIPADWELLVFLKDFFVLSIETDVMGMFEI